MFHLKSFDHLNALVILYYSKITGNFPISWSYNSMYSGNVFAASHFSEMISCLILTAVTVNLYTTVQCAIEGIKIGRNVLSLCASAFHVVITTLTLVICILYRRFKLPPFLNSLESFLNRRKVPKLYLDRKVLYLSSVFVLTSFIMCFRSSDPNLQLNFLTMYLNFLIHICPDLLYGLLISIIVSYVKIGINHNLQKASSFIFPIVNLRQLLLSSKKNYSVAIDLAVNLQQCFCLDILVSVFYCATRTVFFFYITWLEFRKGSNVTGTLGWVLFAQLILVPLRLLFLCYCSHSLTFQVQKTAELLSNICIKMHETSTENTQEIIDVFISQLAAKKGVFTPLALFKMNLAFFCTYVGTVMTYIIIIVQFS